MSHEVLVHIVTFFVRLNLSLASEARNARYALWFYCFKLTNIRPFNEININDHTMARLSPTYNTSKSKKIRVLYLGKKVNKLTKLQYLNYD